MTFKAYDLLSSLIPGFLCILVFLDLFDGSFNKDTVVPYTAVAFFLGFLVNTLSSWLEDLYFFTWRGKPSSLLINGRDIWKVRFYSSAKAKTLLFEETRANANNDELFGAAMRVANGQKDTRVEDFNAMYAFSRSLLTTSLISTPLLLIEHYDDWHYYAVLIPILGILWLRCKQRAYYYAREVLNVYLKTKAS